MIKESVLETISACLCKPFTEIDFSGVHIRRIIPGTISSELMFNRTYTFINTFNIWPFFLFDFQNQPARDELQPFIDELGWDAELNVRWFVSEIQFLENMFKRPWLFPKSIPEYIEVTPETFSLYKLWKNDDRTKCSFVSYLKSHANH